VQRLADVRRRLTRCTTFVRSFLNELRPNVLDELGLCEALSEYVAAQQQIVPFRIALRLDPGLAQWRSGQDAMLFRLIQEAILNCRKHADATAMTISLERKEFEGVKLEITDNGKGFAACRPQMGHYGLSMMRERAAACGGTMEIDSAPGAGTRIAVRFRHAAGAPR
jgi:signal transduction histidine kinase